MNIIYLKDRPKLFAIVDNLTRQSKLLKSIKIDINEAYEQLDKINEELRDFNGYSQDLTDELTNVIDLIDNTKKLNVIIEKLKYDACKVLEKELEEE